MLIPHDHNNPHPLLRQIPLTVSPFISLPSAPTLPYTYKSLPSTLPPPFHSPSDHGPEHDPSKYVISPSGHAASPEEIINSCQSIQKHIETTHSEALKAVEDWEKKLKEEELLEKRKVAPGWLDRGERMLEPARVGKASAAGAGHGDKGETILDQSNTEILQGQQIVARPDSAGEELDRAFGGMGV